MAAKEKSWMWIHRSIFTWICMMAKRKTFCFRNQRAKQKNVNFIERSKERARDRNFAHFRCSIAVFEQHSEKSKSLANKNSILNENIVGNGTKTHFSNGHVNLCEDRHDFLPSFLLISSAYYNKHDTVENTQSCTIGCQQKILYLWIFELMINQDNTNIKHPSCPSYKMKTLSQHANNSGGGGSSSTKIKQNSMHEWERKVFGSIT